MSAEKLLTLSAMPAGRQGTIVEIHGGRGFIRRLDAMGIRPGMSITKISSMLMRGPVTVQAGSTRLAIGYGIAGKILVTVKET